MDTINALTQQQKQSKLGIQQDRNISNLRLGNKGGAIKSALATETFEKSQQYQN